MTYSRRVRIKYPHLLLQMAQELQSQLGQSFKESITISSSNTKKDVQNRRQKKKKLAAFKTFLDNKLEPSPLEDLPKRKFSNEQLEEVNLETIENCKICSSPLQSQSRLCQFCKQIVCTSHLRKRRRFAQTNKWTRICEHCEDKYLMEKHYQNQTKTQQSLMSQELIVGKRYSQLSEILSSKKIKLQMLLNKKTQLQATAKKQKSRLLAQQNDLSKKLKKLDILQRQVGNLQLINIGLQKSLPESLQAIYEFLVEENARITKDLVKYQKLCNEAVQARSKRQKEMYREYYEWEQQKLQELQQEQPQQEQNKKQCNIY